MKRSLPFLTLASLAFTAPNVMAQDENPVHTCGAERVNRAIEADALSKANRSQFENWMENKIATNRQKGPQADQCAAYVIPVVVHIYGKTQHGKTVDNALIKDMMKRVNEDYNGNNDDYGSVTAAFQARRATLDITFALTTKDVDGNPIPVTGDNPDGLSIVYHGVKSGLGNGNAGAQVAADAWDNYKFMNVYIMADLYGDGGCCSSGVAWYPDSGMSTANTARVVYNGQYVAYNTSKEFSSVMTHEFGHWLDLRHTFAGGCNAPGDLIDDTPADNTNSSNCTPNTSCTEPENNENYMDYSQCYRMFTEGQVERMIAALDHPARKTLWDPANLTLLGLDHLFSSTNPPSADFDINQNNVCAGSTIEFKDKSTCFPDSHAWEFEGGIPATSTDKNPSVSYAAEGTYKVKLTVTNTNGSNVKEEMNYIVISSAAATIPFAEDFEGSFPPAGWSIFNPDNGLAWEQRTDAGKGSSSCMIMNNADNAVEGEIDEIQLGRFNFNGYTSMTMTFDVAYTQFNATSPDKLEVLVSGDCGKTWDPAVYSKTHTELETKEVLQAESNAWIPSTGTDWRNESIDLTSYINKTVAIKFSNSSGYGTRVWVDNVNVDGIKGTGDLDKASFGTTFYPNPSNGLFQLEMNHEINGAFKVEIFNTVGQLVAIDNLVKGSSSLTKEINLSNLSAGIYTAKVSNADFFFAKKLIIE